MRQWHSKPEFQRLVLHNKYTCCGLMSSSIIKINTSYFYKKIKIKINLLKKCADGILSTLVSSEEWKKK